MMMYSIDQLDQQIIASSITSPRLKTNSVTMLRYPSRDSNRSMGGAHGGHKNCSTEKLLLRGLSNFALEGEEKGRRGSEGDASAD